MQFATNFLNTGSKRFRRIVSVIIGVVVGYLVLAIVGRLICQYAPAPVFVTVSNPLPDELRAKLPSLGLNISATVLTNVPYNVSTEQRISETEIERIRRTLAWGSVRRYRPSELQIRSATTVVAIVPKGRSQSYMITLVQENGEWKIVSMDRGRWEKIKPDFFDRVAGAIDRLMPGLIFWN